MVCFIILHYIVEEETVKCIDTIKLLDGEKRIIIVDNNSPNQSGKRLLEKYENDGEIDVILNKSNDGFAKGNNVGCEYARDKYCPDFYVVMNNDIEIVQKDFIDRVDKIYKDTKFDVLGPDIYSTTQNKHQSPKSIKRTSIEGARRLRTEYEKKVKSKYIVPIRCVLKNIPLLNKINEKNKKKRDGVNYRKKYQNVPLHGSCLIFSEKFVAERAHVFFDRTFFYYESEILDYECQVGNFLEVYDPSIEVLHHQNVSTKYVYGDALKRVRFMNLQNLNSISVFLEEYDVSLRR